METFEFVAIWSEVQEAPEVQLASEIRVVLFGIMLFNLWGLH